MSFFRSFAVITAAFCMTSGASFGADTPDSKASADAKAESRDAPRPRPAADAAAAKKCDTHGVKKTICARCKPKLAAAYKAKGDWCSEHERPESQCAICKPALEKEGVKP